VTTRLVLHNYWRSSASYRVRIGLGLKGLAYDYVAVNIIAGEGEQKRDDYRDKNPMAQVPTLEVIEDGKSRYLQQSLAILEYLDERFPEPPLLPRDQQDSSNACFLRARARALAEVVNSGIQPLQNLSVTRKVHAFGGDDKAWVKGFIADGLAALEAQVQETAGRFCVGDAPTIADCCLIPQLYSANRFGVPVEHFPYLCLIMRACHEIPAFAEAHPDRQPDAVRS
jgi:maleylpyruvate isomerase